MHSYTPLLWLFLNLVFLMSNAFYSMLEMAAISFDKVRLQYYVSKGNQRIIWLAKLLAQPFRLFGTTLIGVNLSLVIGSECARQFFSSLGYSADWAALPQIITVIIFGELAPMFAARRHPEHVVMLGIPVIWISSIVLAPILWFIGTITNFFTQLLGDKKSSGEFFLGRDELVKLLETHDDHYYHPSETEEFTHIFANIFLIAETGCDKVMRPLETIQMVESKCVTSELRKLCRRSRQPFFPVYKLPTNAIIGVVYPRDLIRVPDNRRVRDYARQPWFIDHRMKLVDILKEFRTNNESLALVINERGDQIGYITLDHILSFIFGSMEPPLSDTAKRMVLIDRTLDAQMLIEEVEKEFGIVLDAPKEMTLEDLALKELGEHPEVGESFPINAYEIVIEEISLLDIKKVKLKSKVI
jgi:CBS domain containing-hemolysin-like protein